MSNIWYGTSSTLARPFEPSDSGPVIPYIRPGRGILSGGVVFQPNMPNILPGHAWPVGRRVPSSRHPAGMTRCGALRQAALGTRRSDLISTAVHEWE